jgi:hypothetical protein
MRVLLLPHAALLLPALALCPGGSRLLVGVSRPPALYSAVSRRADLSSRFFFSLLLLAFRFHHTAGFIII